MSIFLYKVLFSDEPIPGNFVSFHYMFLDGKFLLSSLFGSISLLVAVVFSFIMSIIYSLEYTYIYFYEVL